MSSLIAWFARNRVAANLLMIAVIAAGLLTIDRLVIEFFPDMSARTISVTVPYLGAAPEEVEQGVVTRIEEAVDGIDGIEEIRATAAENVGTVLIEIEDGTDMAKALDEVKTRVDAIATFPEETEKPIVQEIIVRTQTLTVAVSGQTDRRTLKRIAERIRDDLSSLPEVSLVQLAAAPGYEISIEVSEQALRRYRLTFDEVVRAVQRASIDLPGGTIKTDGGEILLRTKGQVYHGPEFEQLPLRTGVDGTRLLLGDVATVVDGFADADLFARFDGEPAVLIQVFRVGDQNALRLAEEIQDYIQHARAELPSGVSLTTWGDETVLLRGRLSLLLENGRAGLILVFIVLALFLKLRLAGWVSVGILVSFMGAIAMMPTLDVSVNMISLFAFVMVLGIVVDDAIVVGENIYRHHERGRQGLAAAIAGAREVGIPVTFSVLTTIAAFVPMLNVAGSVGPVMRVIPLVVISCLVFSLLESLLVLPAHLSHLRRKKTRPQSASTGVSGVWYRFQGLFTDGLQRVIERAYRPALERCLSWRYLTVAVALVLLIFTVGLVASGWIGFVFFPPIEADNAVMELAMPQGTPTATTAAIVERIEQAAFELERELQREGHADAFRHVLAIVGAQPYRDRQAQVGGRTGDLVKLSKPHLGEVNIELAPAEERTISSHELVGRWRELSGPVPGATELTFTSNLVSFGNPIDVELHSADLGQLERAAAAVRRALADYAGVYDITDSHRTGKQELLLDVRPEAESLGLSLADVGRQVRQAFYGAEAQRVQRGRDDVRVMVRYPEAERETLSSLETMRLRTATGGEVPFPVAATARLARGFDTIERIDRQRTVSVTADVELGVANPNEINADLARSVLPSILDEFPRVSYSLEGEQKEQRESLSGLGRGFALSLIMIFALLAIPFRSYVQPLIVMSAIPFGLIGAVWGHVLLGMDLTVVSGFGVVALTGVVVNDSLVLVDFINRQRRSGVGLDQAIRDAGAARFRAILLTSLTTFAGLSPMLLERSLQAQFLIPMAVSLAFGVLFATAITLVLVPVLYRVLEDVTRFAQRRPQARAGATAEITTA